MSSRSPARAAQSCLPSTNSISLQDVRALQNVSSIPKKAGLNLILPLSFDSPKFITYLKAKREILEEPPTTSNYYQIPPGSFPQDFAVCGRCLL
jgi:hypothetical protein